MLAKLDVGHRTTKNITLQDLFENTLQKIKQPPSFPYLETTTRIG
jgi:hypothetical protein